LKLNGSTTIFMSCSLTLYKPSEFIRKTANGTLDMARSRTGRARPGRGGQVSTGTATSCSTCAIPKAPFPTVEQMKLAMEFGQLPSTAFTTALPSLSRPTSDRIEKANLMKRCMDAEGFEMKVFVDFEHVVEWFSEVTPLAETRPEA
jgi:hypothetical protein